MRLCNTGSVYAQWEIRRGEERERVEIKGGPVIPSAERLGVKLVVGEEHQGRARARETVEIDY
jgi:hypothetical protein